MRFAIALRSVEQPFSESRSRGGSAFLRQGGTNGDGVLVIDVEHGDGRAANRGFPEQPESLPLEMLGPHVSARVEKACELPGFRIETGDVRAFAEIAREAGPGEIHTVRRTAVLLSDDVVEMERQLAR